MNERMVDRSTKKIKYKKPVFNDDDDDDIDLSG